MARSSRIEFAGAWHHVSARGVERRAIYRDEPDRRHFIELLGETVASFRWRLHAYVLMDNHYHLLVETPEPNLGRGMQWLNTSYCVWFNRRHQRSGHLLQDRFKSIIVDPQGWGLELSRYLHLNPVRVRHLGLDKAARLQGAADAGAPPRTQDVRARIARLRAYRWSSYRAYLQTAAAPDWLVRQRILALGGGSREQAAGNYRRYVEDAIRQGLAIDPWEQLRDGVILGRAQFTRRLASAFTKSRARRRLTAPALEEIIGVVEALKGEKWSQFRDRHGDWGRDLVFYLARKHWAVPLRHLAAAAQGMDQVAVSMAARRVPARAEADQSLADAIEKCNTQLQMLNV